jgi:hypothetical protein
MATVKGCRKDRRLVVAAAGAQLRQSVHSFIHRKQEFES